MLFQRSWIVTTMPNSRYECTSFHKILFLLRYTCICKNVSMYHNTATNSTVILCVFNLVYSRLYLLELDALSISCLY